MARPTKSKRRGGGKLRLVERHAPVRASGGGPPPDEYGSGDGGGGGGGGELEEVGVSDIRAGDVIRVRAYEGLPGLLFGAPARYTGGGPMDGKDEEVVRIEEATMPSNGFYRAYPVRVALCASGRCIRLDQSDYWRVRRSPAVPVRIWAKAVLVPLSPALPPGDPRALPEPGLLREMEYLDPDDFDNTDD